MFFYDSYTILKHLNSFNILSSRQLKYMYNSFTFLHALIITGSTLDEKKSSHAKLNDLIKEKLDLFLAKLYVSLNLEIAGL